MNSFWLILVSLSCFILAYRFYSAFLTARVLMLDDSRETPAFRLRDGVDYHPTNKLVLFGHHFAAIAGAGPLLGPVIAAQWGYLPGYSWIIVGACLAGAVHDLVVLAASVRYDGQSLSHIAAELLGPFAAVLTALVTLFTVICVLAGAGVSVVNALSESAWATFTIIVTVPAALTTGLWMYKIRPGKLGEASAIGIAIVLTGVLLGKPIADSHFAAYLAFSKPALSIILPAYSALAAILPVWLLMCPRDYLSSYMKIGVIAILAVGITIAHPTLNMPAFTHFIDGSGPIVPGPVWPFVCIVIMCGALSGFHALIASGTTPKIISRERDIRAIGYGAMLVEGFVSVCALVAACALQPGDYYAIDVPQDSPQQKSAYTRMVAEAESVYHWNLHPVELPRLAAQVNEKLEGRVGGAVTLAIGMAKVFARLPGMTTLTAYWYHFVIMFEALFILTLIETGTRVARFIFQECLVQLSPRRAARRKGKVNWLLNIFVSIIVCSFWGYLLYSGTISSLWRIFGIANQLISAVALIIGTSFILKYAPRRSYALCTLLPLAFVLATVFPAGVMTIQSWQRELAAIPAGTSKAFYLNLISVLSGVMMALTALILIRAVPVWLRLSRAMPPAPAGGEMPPGVGQGV